MTKWLSENCADTNATVLQNSRLFMDHISNVYKDKIAMYETRDDMERLSPGSANPNAFSDMVTRLCKEYNDAHPNWQATGGDVVMLGPLALNTCLKGLLLADGLHVVIMVPRPARTPALPSMPSAVAVAKRAEASGLPGTGLHSGKFMCSFPNCLRSVILRIQKTTQ